MTHLIDVVLDLVLQAEQALVKQLFHWRKTILCHTVRLSGSSQEKKMTTPVYTLTIFYTNGEQQKFAIPTQGDESSLSKRIAEFRSSDELLIQTKEKMIFVPFHNVLRLEVEPSPHVFAQNALHGAKQVS
jgi:hypothetical protein